MKTILGTPDGIERLDASKDGAFNVVWRVSPGLFLGR